MIQTIGTIAAVSMPFFNIPLIYRIVKRKSSADISFIWAAGVWACVIGMLPSCLQSSDLVLRSFGIVNTVMFSAAFAVICWYHPRFRKSE